MRLQIAYLLLGRPNPELNEAVVGPGAHDRAIIVPVNDRTRHPTVTRVTHLSPEREKCPQGPLRAHARRRSEGRRSQACSPTLRPQRTFSE